LELEPPGQAHFEPESAELAQPRQVLPELAQLGLVHSALLA